MDFIKELLFQQMNLARFRGTVLSWILFYKSTTFGEHFSSKIIVMKIMQKAIDKRVSLLCTNGILISVFYVLLCEKMMTANTLISNKSLIKINQKIHKNSLF